VLLTTHAGLAEIDASLRDLSDDELRALVERARIYAAWNAGRFTLLISEPIRTEGADVLGRPEVLRKLRMTPIEAAALVELLRRQSTRVTPTVQPSRAFET